MGTVGSETFLFKEYLHYTSLVFVEEEGFVVGLHLVVSAQVEGLVCALRNQFNYRLTVLA